MLSGLLSYRSLYRTSYVLYYTPSRLTKSFTATTISSYHGPHLSHGTGVRVPGLSDLLGFFLSYGQQEPSKWCVASSEADTRGQNTET